MLLNYQVYSDVLDTYPCIYRRLQYASVCKLFLLSNDGRSPLDIEEIAEFHRTTTADEPIDPYSLLDAIEIAAVIDSALLEAGIN